MKSEKQPELFSVENEESLIGAVVIDPAVFPMLGITPEHFFIQRLGDVWRAIDSLYLANTAIDFVTICDELGKMGKLDYIGGQSYLMRLINQTPSSLHVQDYARTVKEYYRRRKWKDIAGKVARAAFDLDVELEKEASLIVDEILTVVQSDDAAVHISNYAKQVLDEVYERMNDPKDIWGIPTGFIDFDEITGGLQLGELLYLSGEPGIGKSILAAQMAKQMAAAEYPGVVYSLEMQGKQVVRRWLSADAQVITRNIKTGRIDDGQFQRIGKEVEIQEKLPLYLSDSALWNTATMRADLARLKVQKGVQWFVVDYAYLLQDGAGLSETDKTGFVSQQMKAICRSLNLAGIVIHSLTKEGIKNTMPEGVNLRGSGQMFYDTDLLLMMKQGSTPNTVSCIFGKGRELEKPKQAFELVRVEGYPKLGNAARVKERQLSEFAP